LHPSSINTQVISPHSTSNIIPVSFGSIDISIQQLFTLYIWFMFHQIGNVKFLWPFIEVIGIGLVFVDTVVETETAEDAITLFSKYKTFGNCIIINFSIQGVQ
jgi:hypothetical protein